MSVTGSISAISLGATLYIPCMRGDLFAAVLGSRRPAGLRSVVLCLEDSVREADLPEAMGHLAAFLRMLTGRAPSETDPLVFVRPRSAAMLEHILCMPGSSISTVLSCPRPMPTRCRPISRCPCTTGTD
jgi:citrate lyase beta subunit